MNERLKYISISVFLLDLMSFKLFYFQFTTENIRQQVVKYHLTHANIPVKVDIITALSIIHTQQKLRTVNRDALFTWLQKLLLFSTK